MASKKHLYGHFDCYIATYLTKFSDIEITFCMLTVSIMGVSVILLSALTKSIDLNLKLEKKVSDNSIETSNTFRINCNSATLDKLYHINEQDTRVNSNISN
jgi:hypothetical protein